MNAFRQLIPAPVIAATAQMLANRNTHSAINNLFMSFGAPGDPPDGNKIDKCTAWLRRLNQDETVEPLSILGQLIEECMDEALVVDKFDITNRIREREAIDRALKNSKLQYISGGKVLGALGAPSKSLELSIRERSFPTLAEEFERALESVEVKPREALSSACNILECTCKVYIEDENLELPPKQDLQPLWNIVRKDLGFDPSSIEDQDLKKILTGLISIVDGVGALRTHASSAHGAGRTRYRVEPRHARLAIHASHTVVHFVLETWDNRKKSLS